MRREGATLEVKSSNVASKLPQDSFELCSSELGGKRLRGIWESSSKLWTWESAGPEERCLTALVRAFCCTGTGLILGMGHGKRIQMFPEGEKLETELAWCYLGSYPTGLSRGVRRPWQAAAGKWCLMPGLRKES